jgi:HAD superfamily hydrolase (TIGR01450 family)
MQPWQTEGGCYAGQDPPRQSRLAPPRPPGALAGRDDRGEHMTAVAVVGLGAMGSRIAARLVAAGHEVTAWNRSAGKAEPLAELGAFPAATPAEAASRAEVLITMVADPAALRAVTEGPDGVIAGASASLTVVEMSTVGPAAVARLASVLPPATGLLDAPVLGSLAEAESGSLVIFAGGAAQLVERVLPVLAAVGSVLHVGELGAGAAAKLMANAALFATLGTLGEAIALARGLGLSAEAAYRVLAATPLAAQAERRRAAIEVGEYPPRFPLTLARKDARLIADAAAGAGVGLRLTAAAGTWLAEAEEAGLGGRDYTAMLKTILHGHDSGPSPARPDAPPARGAELVGDDGLIIDLDGVVWLGGDPIPGAAEAIAAVRGSGTRVLFVTNEPRRSRSAIAEHLIEIGIPATTADVMTSAAVAARVAGSLPGLANGRALVVGPPALHDEVKGAGFRLVACEEAREAGVVIVGGHEGFDYRELRAAAAAVRAGARLLATGRDAVFPAADGPWPATGAILAAIETAGGMPAVVVGKPERIIFDIAREALAGCERIGVIGDHLTTDIEGAKRAGLDAILVLTGATNLADLERAPIPPDLVLDSLATLPEAIRARA